MNKEELAIYDKHYELAVTNLLGKKVQVADDDKDLDIATLANIFAKQAVTNRREATKELHKAPAFGLPYFGINFGLFERQSLGYPYLYSSNLHDATIAAQELDFNIKEISKQFKKEKGERILSTQKECIGNAKKTRLAEQKKEMYITLSQFSCIMDAAELGRYQGAITRLLGFLEDK